MNQRPIMPEDLSHYRWISQPVISPNGQVAYVEQTIDQDKNEYNTQIRGISLDGDEDIALSDGTKDSSPAWSPDGTQAHIHSLSGWWQRTMDAPFRSKRAGHADISRT